MQCDAYAKQPDNQLSFDGLGTKGEVRMREARLWTREHISEWTWYKRRALEKSSQGFRPSPELHAPGDARRVPRLHTQRARAVPGEDRDGGEPGHLVSHSEERRRRLHDGGAVMGWKHKVTDLEYLIVYVDEVVGKQRARTVRANGITRSFTPRKTADFERAIRDAWIDKVGVSRAGFTGPVLVTINYGRELAKSNPKYWAGREDTGKPDLDNVVKSVLDALSGVAFADDSQVVQIECGSDFRAPHGSGNRMFVSVSYVDETYEKE